METQSLRTAKTFIALFLLAFLSALLGASPANAGPKVKGWLIEQQSTSEGKTTILICDKGARISWHNCPFYCVCSAPEFKCSMINLSRKVEMTLTPSLWKTMAPHVSSDSVKFGTATSAPEPWYGKPATRLSYKITSSDPYASRMEQVFRDGHDRSASVEKSEFLYSNWIKLSPGMMQFFNGYYRYPDYKMIPLEYSQQYSNGRKLTLLKTSSVKETMIDLADLQLPHGLKTIRDRDTVMEEDKRQERLDGVMSGFFGIEKQTDANKK